MHIRPAKIADIPAIIAIWNPYIRDTIITFTDHQKTEKSLAMSLAEKEALHQPFLVAKINKTIAGFATYAPFRPGPGYAFTMEHSIVVDPNATKRGVGRKLLSELEKIALENGVRSLFAGVSSENTTAIAFHTACGYETSAHLRQVGWKFGRWHDLVLMQKQLWG